MRHVIVRYTVKPGRAQENEQLVRAVYEELHRDRPAGLSYATLRLDDGVSFMHIAANDEDHNPLSDVAAFGRFQEGIRERCAEPPVVTLVTVVGSYGMFGA